MIKALLLDLSGVLYIGDRVLPGAIESLIKLQAAHLPHCFITNTSRKTTTMIQASLQQMGFTIHPKAIFTTSTATLNYLQQYQLRPHLLIHPNLSTEFSKLDCQHPNAVVLGDAAEQFNYNNLNDAFRVLMKDDTYPLISMGDNRYFMEQDGLSLDLGAFTRALEYASNRTAIVLGKPSKDFFHQAINKLGVKPEQVLMIGDDVYSDIEGALNAGLQACLVKTGKYQVGDEGKINEDIDYLANDINDAIDWVLTH